MTLQIRLTRSLYDQARRDLVRPHPFAAERVGFFFCKLSVAGDHAIVLLTRYESLADDRYIDDPWAGARIDSVAIRGAMQQVIDRREGVFHVHLHACPGIPRLSEMDRTELPRVVSGFRNAGAGHAHGMFLLSHDACVAWVWLPGSAGLKAAGTVTVVGYPMGVHGGVP